MDSVIKCMDQYDFGMSKEIENSNEKSKNIFDNHNTCIMKCPLYSKNDQSEVKSCVKTCYEKSYLESRLLTNNLIKKIDEVQNKLIKL
jgi:hypothetical protein